MIISGMKKMTILTLFLSSFLIIAEGDKKTECPPPMLTPSCSCEVETINVDCKFIFWQCRKVHRVLLTCYDAIDMWDFINVLHSLEDYNVYSLHYHSLNMQYIPKGFLKYLPITSLNISDSVILGLETDDSEAMFEGAIDTIELFQVHNVEGAKSWRWKALSSLKNLTEVLVINCDLTEIPHDFNLLPKSLRAIGFAGNKITTIYNNTLNNFHEVFLLYMSNNELSVIERYMFPDPAENLTFLLLDNNKITELPQGIFNNMPKLFHVNLSSNRIKWLSLTMFEPLYRHHGWEIRLLDNNIFCCSAQMWLVDSDFKHNVIAQCAAPAPLAGKIIPTLKAADLRHGLC